MTRVGRNDKKSGDPRNTRNPPARKLATSFRKGGITKILPFLKGVPAGGGIFSSYSSPYDKGRLGGVVVL